MKLIYIDCYYGFDASMLLAALIDAGASEDKIRELISQQTDEFLLEVSEGTACSVECKTAHTEGISAENRYGLLNPCVGEAVMAAIKAIGADFVISSPLGVPDNLDGDILSLIENNGLETKPYDGRYFHQSDAVFLSHIISESGPLPDMEILSVGYGCRSDISDSLVTVYVGSYGDSFAKEELQYENSYSKCQ